MSRIPAPALGGLILLAWGGVAAAQQEMVDQPVWAGTVDLGFVQTSGNTEGTTLAFSLDYGRDGPRWRHALHLESFNQTSDEVRQAEKYLGYWQSNLKFTPVQSMFFRAQYEEDKFSTYTYQGILSLGYSHRVLDNDKTVLDLEAGPGYRRSQLADNGEIENELIVRLAGNFKWNISETASFGQLLSVEEGAENTTVRSTTSLTMSVYESLAIKLSYKLRWNRVVGPDTEPTDGETNVAWFISGNHPGC
jgi:putative salt-induced outer membrane protein